MLWLIIAAVGAAVFTLMLYACLVAGARADRNMEKWLGTRSNRKAADGEINSPPE